MAAVTSLFDNIESSTGMTLHHESLVVANTEFSLELFKKITETNKADNVFFSPLNISCALAMVCLGAKGSTATQMHETLNFDKVEGDVHVGFNTLFAELIKEGAPYTLSLANRLYGEQSCEFLEKFLADTKTLYLAELEAVDFKRNAEVARLNINKWVEEHTQGKIKNILADGMVGPLTRLVLVNAIYFKGTWKRKFNKDNTKKVEFMINKNKSKPVEMMYQTESFSFADIPDANCKILELPYVGKDLSMFILLPNEISIQDNTTGLETLEQMLTYERFVKWTRNMTTQEVSVGLPKFKLEKTYQLSDILKRMGMVDAFGNSDFSGMSSCPDLVLSEVLQKCFVEVNEESTEAAAFIYTTVFGCPAYMRPPVRFVADHPFLFFIRHNVTRSILFYGRYSNP